MKKTCSLFTLLVFISPHTPTYSSAPPTYGAMDHAGNMIVAISDETHQHNKELVARIRGKRVSLRGPDQLKNHLKAKSTLLVIPHSNAGGKVVRYSCESFLNEFLRTWYAKITDSLTGEETDYAQGQATYNKESHGEIDLIKTILYGWDIDWHPSRFDGLSPLYVAIQSAPQKIVMELGLHPVLSRSFNTPCQLSDSEEETPFGLLLRKYLKDREKYKGTLSGVIRIKSSDKHEKVIDINAPHFNDQSPLQWLVLLPHTQNRRELVFYAEIKDKLEESTTDERLAEFLAQHGALNSLTTHQGETKRCSEWAYEKIQAACNQGWAKLAESNGMDLTIQMTQLEQEYKADEDARDFLPDRLLPPGIQIAQSNRQDQQ